MIISERTNGWVKVVTVTVDSKANAPARPQFGYSILQEQLLRNESCIRLSYCKNVTMDS